jgi:hypothetical protein
VSDDTWNLLKRRFGGEPQPVRNIKGKGNMQTYYLKNAPPDDYVPPSSKPSSPVPFGEGNHLAC